VSEQLTARVDVDLAEDATQQALLSIWRDLPQLRDPEKFDAWSYRLLLRACYAEGRRTRHWTPTLRVLPSAGAASDSSGVIVDRDQLERAFRRLTLEQRAVLVFHHYVGLTLPDVAQRLGIPLGTAKSRLHHATAALRASLEADARTPSIPQERLA